MWLEWSKMKIEDFILSKKINVSPLRIVHLSISRGSCVPRFSLCKNSSISISSIFTNICILDSVPSSKLVLHLLYAPSKVKTTSTFPFDTSNYRTVQTALLVLYKKIWSTTVASTGILGFEWSSSWKKEKNSTGGLEEPIKREKLQL